MEQQTPKMRQNSLKYLCFQQTGITVGLRRRIPDGEGCPKKVSLNFQLKEVFLLRQCACIYIISKYDMWEQLVVGHTDSLPAYIYQPHGLSHAYLFRGEVSSFVAISSFFWADKCRNSIKALKQGTAFAFWRQDKNITLIANIVHFAWQNDFPGKLFQFWLNWIRIIKVAFAEPVFDVKGPLKSDSILHNVTKDDIQQKNWCLVNSHILRQALHDGSGHHLDHLRNHWRCAASLFVAHPTFTAFIVQVFVSSKLLN